MADRDRYERASPRGGSRARLRFAADDRLVALVRRGDATAFEVLYDRHARELLSFCGYLLGSPSDAEDAIQSTFASAHTALLADDRPVDARPWLFTIARNACLSILRAQRPAANGSVQMPRDEHDPVVRAEQRDDMRQLLTTLGQLPERQRVALVLRELHGFGHSEIAALLGVRAAQVKSYLYQARSNVISERDARDADCHAIRHQLANARGAALLKSQLRRHLRSCAHCRAYAAQLSRQRRRLGMLLPFTQSVALKRRALHAALGRAAHGGAHAGGAAAGGASTGGATSGGAATGGAAAGGAATGGAAAGGAATGMSVAATGAELVGGSAKAVIAKLLVGAACVGAGSSAATLVAGVPLAPAPRLLATAQPRLVTRPPLSVRAPIAEPVPFIPTAAPRSAPVARASATDVSHAAPQLASQPPATAVARAWQASRVDTAVDPAASATRVPASASDEAHGTHSASDEAHGTSEQAHGKSEQPHGEDEQRAPARGESEEAHGESEERAPVRGGSEEARGRSEEAHGESEAGEQPHVNSEAANGNSEAGEATHGNSEAGEQPHGTSEAAHGSGEAAQGNGEEAHGNGAN